MDAFALQKALFERLSTDPALVGLGVSVYDVAPQGNDESAAAGFPRVIVGDLDIRDAGTRSSDIFDVLARLHTFSAAASYGPVRAIQKRLFDLLHRATFSVEGYRLIMCRRDASSIDRDPDRVVHAVCDFRILIEPI